MSCRMVTENVFESQIQIQIPKVTECQIIHLYIRGGGCIQKVKIYLLLQELRELSSTQNKKELTSQQS